VAKQMYLKVSLIFEKNKHHNFFHAQKMFHLLKIGYIPLFIEHKPRFVAGSCYIPHPKKKWRGGEDAHFTSPTKLAVCDGVSQWYDDDIDAGVFALKIVQNLETSRAEEPVKMLKEAADNCKEIEGSATVCVAQLGDKSLKVCNMGDAGIRVYRKTATSSWNLFNRITDTSSHKLIAASKPMRHGNDCPYQIGSHETADDPNSATTYEFSIQADDVIVMGTDGLWDAIPDVAEILDVTELEEPAKIAWQIGTLAFQASERMGEFDDITVIVARIV
jgi:serine/threonine protein phosphatase PrpC